MSTPNPVPNGRSTRHKRGRRTDLTIRRVGGSFLLTPRTGSAYSWLREFLDHNGPVTVDECDAGPLADAMEGMGLKLRDEHN